MKTQDILSHSINFTDQVLLQRKDAFLANQLERPSERRDVTTCLTTHLILGCSDDQSDLQEFHRKMVVS